MDNGKQGTGRYNEHSIKSTEHEKDPDRSKISRLQLDLQESSSTRWPLRDAEVSNLTRHLDKLLLEIKVQRCVFNTRR